MWSTEVEAIVLSQGTLYLETNIPSSSTLLSLKSSVILGGQIAGKNRNFHGDEAPRVLSTA